MDETLARSLPGGGRVSDLTSAASSTYSRNVDATTNLALEHRQDEIIVVREYVVTSLACELLDAVA